MTAKPMTNDRDHSELTSITGKVVGFCRFARAQGLPVGVQETIDALRTARLGMIAQKKTLRLSLRALLCTSKDERDLFDALFAAYWQQTPQRQRQSKRQAPGTPFVAEQKTIPLLTIGADAKSEVEGEGKSTSGASAQERLRKTDF
ncbi:MAG TPA: hypothetical protein VKP65_04720, partial [Rhodothermales bacterium]|nr:hypothetical protein [Rhodothermales bacterium]